MPGKNSTRRPAAGAKPRPKSRAAAPKPAVAHPDDEQIRLRAYELYVQRGRQPGDPVEDWLRAQRTLIEETQTSGW